MKYKYDFENNFLQVNNSIIPSYDLNSHSIGFCTSCDAEMVSKSYHNIEENIAVVSYCTSCDEVVVNFFDNKWNWLNEEHISDFFSYREVKKPFSSLTNDLLKGPVYYTNISKVPMNKLQVIFSTAEITAMQNKSNNEKYVRQYLYRARKKYKHFEDVFEIYLNI